MTLPVLNARHADLSVHHTVIVSIDGMCDTTVVVVVAVCTVWGMIVESSEQSMIRTLPSFLVKCTVHSTFECNACLMASYCSWAVAFGVGVYKLDMFFLTCCYDFIGKTIRD